VQFQKLPMTMMIFYWKRKSKPKKKK